MKSYAGIGSRNITKEEKERIVNVAKLLKSKNYTLYSGNAEGADITFQNNSKGDCIVFLPWKKFNYDKYNYEVNSREFVIVDKTKHKEAFESVEKFHPRPQNLKHSGEQLMARNYFQIMGYGDYSMVDFVVCCADPIGNGVKGGTGQAIRIAKSLNIPIINLREVGWLKKIKEIIK